MNRTLNLVKPRGVQPLAKFTATNRKIAATEKPLEYQKYTKCFFLTNSLYGVYFISVLFILFYSSLVGLI